MPAPEVDIATARTLLRECHTRRLDREGIPMVLALVDERGTLPPARDEQSRADGARYADLLGRYTDALVPPPQFRPDDEGGLITAMQVLAYAHFGPGAASPPGAIPSDTAAAAAAAANAQRVPKAQQDRAQQGGEQDGGAGR